MSSPGSAVSATPPCRREVALLYHIPQTTGVPISDGVLDALLASHDEVIYGLKDSTGDPAQLAHFRTAYPQLAYYAATITGSGRVQRAARVRLPRAPMCSRTS